MYNKNTLLSFSSALRMAEYDPPPMTQEGRSTVKYAWIILFNYSINEAQPFSIVPLSNFVGSNFPWETVEGALSPEYRMRTWNFSNMPDDTFTIFAKVEVGKF